MRRSLAHFTPENKKPASFRKCCPAGQRTIYHGAGCKNATARVYPIPFVMRIVFPLSLALLSIPQAGHAAVDYASQVQPLWDAHCTDCHSASDADGDFAIDTVEALLKGGESGQVIIPGKADESLLIKFLEGRSGRSGKNQFMPPGKREHLKPEEIALVKQWINEGAKAPHGTGPADPLAKLPKIATKSAVRSIHSAAVSSDGKLAALGRYGSLEFIDLTARQLLRTVTGIAGKPSALTFSRDGSTLFAAAGDAGVRGVAYAIRSADGTILKTFTGHTDALHTLALSPDGSLLATGGYDQKIRLWDVASGSEVKVLTGHNGSINGLCFRPDGKVLASASADRTIKLWEVPSGTRLDTFSQPTKEQFAVAFSQDGKALFAGGADNRARMWSISPKATEGTNPLLATKFAHEGTLLGLVLSPDGMTLLSAASDKTIKLWEAASLTERALLETQSDWPNAAAWVGSDRLLVARQDGTSALYATVKPSSPEPLLAVAKPKPAPPAKPTPKPVKPELTRFDPPGFQIGATTRIRALGKNLAGVKEVKSTDLRVKAKLVEDAASPLIEIESAPDLPRGSYGLSLLTAGGETARMMLLADELPHFTSPPKEAISSPGCYFGTLKSVGQQDGYPFAAKKGEITVLDLTAKTIGSKAETIQLEVFDSSGQRLALNRGLDSGTDPFIAFQAPHDGTFTARVSETTLDGSDLHFYRLTLGRLPFIVGWWPLEVPAGTSSELNLVGYNLQATKVQVSAGPNDMAPLPEELRNLRSRYPLKIPTSPMRESLESEPNDQVTTATPLRTPGAINGRLYNSADSDQPDVDCFSIEAKAGQSWIIETAAARYNAPTDTKIEVLTPDGAALERIRLRAVRDTWNNFRSVDADNPDIRLEYWTEMDLDDYVYFNGDVMRIFRNPRGPDAGFLFYNHNNKRIAWFDTTATGHALDEPAYVVQPLKPGENPVPNGLPVFSLPFANDDDGLRRMGRDSRLTFTAPADGRYIIRVTDSRGWSGERFAYRLILREPKPDFQIALTGTNAQSVGAGGSMGFSLRADRQDGFEDSIKVEISGLPQGWFASTPVIIQAGHALATGSLHAEANAPANADFSKVRVTASAVIEGKTVTKDLTAAFGQPNLAAAPKFIAHLEPATNDKPTARTTPQPQEIVLAPGESVPAFIRVDRRDEKGLLNFDVHNLPFGVIVDNIGLNGVQVREGEDVREIFLTAAKWVPEQERLIHAAVASARTEQSSEGLATSYPVLLKIRKPKGVAQK